MSGDPVGPNVAVLEQTLALLDMLDDGQHVHVESRLAALPASALDASLRVRQQGSCEKGRFDECNSRADRELLFLQSHSVHHHALVAILARAQGLALPETFGMAPSTVHWLTNRAPCAR